jgi:lysophospholipase L1-like esterase
LIQFGANDATSTCPRHVSTSDYQVLLGTMAKVTQEKGATPIFVTPTSQLSCGSGTPQPTLTAYADAAKAAGRASGVPVIDLNALTVEHYRSLGCAKTTSTVFAPDQATHFTEPGAKAVAGLVAKALITIQSPLARYLQ